MKLIQPIVLVLLCIVFVPSEALGQTAKIDALKEKAEKGDAVAQHELGSWYGRKFSGREEALEWILKAGNQGYLDAIRDLGDRYMRVLKDTYSLEEGRKWYLKAAEKGDLVSILALANSYKSRDSMHKHRLDYYNKFKETDSKAMWAKDKESEQIDDKLSLKWFLKAAEMGHIHSQKRVAGLHYTEGLGVRPNAAISFGWRLRAANQGDGESQYILAMAYMKGKGVLEDFVESYKWFNIASVTVEAMQEENRTLIVYRERSRQPDTVSESIYDFAIYNQRLMEEISEKSRKRSAKRGVRYKPLPPISVLATEDVVYRKEILRRNMTVQQVTEAQRRSKSFKPIKEIKTEFISVHGYHQYDDSFVLDGKKTNWKSSVSTAGVYLDDLPLDIFKGPLAKEKRAVGFGSGFYVTSNGYLLTNQHVVNGAREVFIYSGAKKIPAKVVKTDAANDLALLKVSGTFAALPVSSSRRVKLGQTVSTVGFPNPDLQGKSPKLTKGEISSLSGASDDPKYFQISVPLQPGNSGGPLVDGYGNVVGVVTAKLSTKAALATAGTLPENVNYAVKGTFVMGFLESVPDVAAEMLDPKPRRSREFTEVVSESEKASVMILVYE
ncbi:trypsin-like peptidase domain-containing protein [bacterium]|nr:trypsin-like peptidase domain-containing protein [bacterium]